MTPLIRRVRRAMVFVIVTFTVLFALAAPAFAHAVLEGSNPAPQASLTSAPKAVTLDFSEKVDVRSDGIRLIDGKGGTVDIGKPSHPAGEGKKVRVALPKLAKGLYTVAWRATSADSHPVQGAFTWGYGVDASSAAAQRLTQHANAQEKGDSTVGVLFGVMRFGVFVGLALLLGAGWFAAYLWPEGRHVPRARQLLLGSLVLTAASTVLGFLLQGPYTSGGSLGDVFSSDQISAVWDTRFGKVWMARLLLLFVASLLLRMMIRRHGPLPGWWFAAAGAVGLALSATPGLAGHPSTGRWTMLALPADMFHVLGMAVWLGGLVMLAIARTDEHSYARVAERFSGLALGAVVLIVVTGVFQALRQLQPFSALWNSDYGRLLIVKLVAFGGILLIAAWSRRLVHGPGMGIFAKPTTEPAPAAAAATPLNEVLEEGGVATLVRADTATVATVTNGHQSRLKRSVRGELVFGALVLAVTAMLVNTSPPHSAASSGPVEVTLPAAKVVFAVHFGPSSFVGGVSVGQPNVLHLTITNPAGSPRDVVDAKASLSNPGQNIAPIPVKLSHENTGFYAGSNILVPFPGTWKLTITAFLTDVDATTASTPVTVG